MQFSGWSSPKKIDKPMVLLSFWIVGNVSLILFSFDCESLFHPDMLVWVSCSRVSNDASPCIIALLKVTLSWTLHPSIALSNKQGRIVTWPSKFHTTILSHSDFFFDTSFPLNFYFLVVEPPTLTYQYIRLTKSKLTSSGWPLLKHSILITLRDPVPIFSRICLWPSQMYLGVRL